VKTGIDGAGAVSGVAGARHGSERPDAAGAREREQKRLLTRAQAQQLLERITPLAELEIHDPALPVEATWTTYLDTDDLRFFASSRSILARRVRIREYTAAATPGSTLSFSGTCFLELKESAGGKRRKLRYRSDRAGIERALRMLPRGECPDPDAALAEIARALAGAALAPRVCTRYRRLSLAAAPRVRITLDEDVRFYRPPAPGEPPGGDPAALVGAVPGVVVEVKGRGAVPAWLSCALEPLDPLPDLSKFRLGFQLLEANPSRSAPAPVVGEVPLVVPSALRRRVVGERP
jgi:hypothetical protein